MKNSYRISNWKQYNKSLINRGSITFWFSEDALNKWNAKKNKKHFGRPYLYSDFAIMTALTLRFVYHLNLRSLEGFLSSLILLLKLPFKTPSYTQICRRAQKLSLPTKILQSKKRITDIVFDASGLKVYGEGEWKVRTHGKSKRRTWRKIHIAMDPNTHNIVLAELTENSSNDGKVMNDLLEEMDSCLLRVYGDGIYDIENCYETIYKKNAEPLIPVRRNAKYKHKAKPHWQARNQQILDIAALGGDEIARSLWKKLKGYHRRSLVETAFYRFKTILGHVLKSRKMCSQIVESKIKCMILNKMNQLGLPLSYIA